MFITSISDNPDFLAENKKFIFSLQNYKSLVLDDSLPFYKYIINSLAISSITALLCTFAGGLAAYAITRFPLKHKSFLMILILAVSMFPQISLVSCLFKMMSSLGCINTYTALALPYTAWTLPLSFWILTNYFEKIPQELDKAGLIDGCSRIQILFKIIYPTAKPGIFSAFILSFIFSFNEFLFALMLTTDSAARTIPVGIALFEGAHGQIPWGSIMAASIIAVSPVILITLIFQKNIIHGLTGGAVKI
ncbi:carbohydrate ABC transporter permease [bacterium]|nr:carbohydrate ABC transporter permease [bacterium]